MQHRPTALILVFLQSAKGWWQLKRGRWKGTCRCYKAEQIFFHSSVWTAWQMYHHADGRIQNQEEDYFRLDQKILPIFYLPLLNLTLTACEHLCILLVFSVAPHSALPLLQGKFHTGFPSKTCFACQTWNRITNIRTASHDS